MTPRIVWSAHLSTLFREHPTLSRPGVARAAGFRVADAWWPEGDVRAWAQRVRASGLRIALLNTPRQSSGSGPWLNDASRRGAALADFERAVELAQLVEAEHVSVPIGDRLPGRERSRDLADVASGLAALAEHAEPAGLTIVIEPLSPAAAPDYLLADTATAANLIEATGSDRVRILFDAFHSAESGRDPAEELAPHADLIAHVQYADSPGRGAPGTGGNDVWRLVDALAGAGYSGAIGLELIPAGSTRDALAFIQEAPRSAPVTLDVAIAGAAR
jgi:hydroxypyruvate isomerase